MIQHLSLHIVPTLNKERKTLSSLLLDYDAAKSRLVNYRQKEGSGNSYLREVLEEENYM